MPLYLNGNKIGNYLYFGNVKIKEAYLNGNRVYRRSRLVHYANTFTTNDTITLPSTATNIQVWIVGGGGGGGGWWYPDNIILGGGGGGAGGYSYKDYGDTLAGTTQNFIVGQGGAGNPNILANGTAGGQSQFGTQSANGGAGGLYTGGGGSGGTASGGSTNTQGGSGGSGGIAVGGAGATGTSVVGVVYGSGGKGYSGANGSSGCCRIEYDYIEYF